MALLFSFVCDVYRVHRVLYSSKSVVCLPYFELELFVSFMKLTYSLNLVENTRPFVLYITGEQSWRFI